MNSNPGEIEPLKPLALVLERDENWRYFGDRTMKQHHGLIEQYKLHSGVPAAVAQHYENARNAWLYSFFAYRLVQVAVFQVHLAGESAIKMRAVSEGINVKNKSLMELLDIAVEQRWLLDINFELTRDREIQENDHLKMLAGMGVPCQPFVGPIHEQAYTRDFVDAFRRIRNAVAHGEVILMHNLSWQFLAIRDVINQLFSKS
jgi:hypothetical protein